MAEIRARGLTVVQRSRGTETDAGSDPAVLLVDTTGELRHLYKVASVIFVGKSLTQHGGQNIVEPAACAKPVVVGPNMENFPDVIRDFLGDSAIVQVADAAELTREIGLLLSDRELRESLGRKAAAVVERKAGCLRAAVEAAMTLLPGRSASR
jgi:3-deoxy-D-manno-octulosonic-acid transferase